MKKIMIVALLSLSIANISCEKAKKEETQWYTSHKKFFLALCVKDLIHIGSSTTISASKDAVMYSTDSFSKEFMQRFPDYFKYIDADYLVQTLFFNLVQTVFFVSIFKEIHNRNQKKKHFKLPKAFDLPLML